MAAPHVAACVPDGGGIPGPQGGGLGLAVFGQHQCVWLRSVPAVLLHEQGSLLPVGVDVAVHNRVTHAFATASHNTPKSGASETSTSPAHKSNPIDVSPSTAKPDPFHTEYEPAGTRHLLTCELALLTAWMALAVSMCVDDDPQYAARFEAQQAYIDYYLDPSQQPYLSLLT